jgi:hypothetical protein
MNAYLVTMDTIFGLIAALHLQRSTEEWPRWATDPSYNLGTSAFGFEATTPTVWPWCLLRLQG